MEAHQASLSIINSWSLLRLMSIESVMLSSHLTLCCPLLFPLSIFPYVRVSANESVLFIRWPKYWSFSFNISPSNEYSGLISFRMKWLVPIFHSFFNAQYKGAQPLCAFACVCFFFLPFSICLALQVTLNRLSASQINIVRTTDLFFSKYILRPC